METIILSFTDFFFLESSSIFEGAAIAPQSRSKPTGLQEKTSEPSLAWIEETSKWGTTSKSYYRCETAWVDVLEMMENWKQSFSRSHALLSISKSCRCHGQSASAQLWSFHRHFPEHSPGVAPPSSTQGCAEPTSPSCPRNAACPACSSQLPTITSSHSGPMLCCSMTPRRRRIWASAEGTWAPGMKSAQNTVPKYCKNR